jgi:hypothetical protein
MPDLNGVLAACFDATNNALRITGSGTAGDGWFVPAAAFTPVTATPAPPAVPASGETARLAFDGAATETAATGFTVPNWWATFAVDLYFVNETAGTGNIRWTVGIKTLATTDLVTEAASPSTSTTIASGAQNQVGVVAGAIASVTNTPFAFGGLYELVVSRLGGDALDTHVGDIGLLGAHIKRLT